MTTKQNIAYFKSEWAGGVPLPELSDANQDAYKAIDELTDGFTDMDMILEDPAFEKMFGYLCDALRRAEGDVPAPKKKAQSAASKARAAKTAQSGRGAHRVKRTRKADASSFADRMRAARAAKKAESTKDSSEPAARSSQKSRAGAKQSTAKAKPAPKAKAEPKAKQPTKTDVANADYAKAEKSGSVAEEIRQIRKFISLVRKATKDQLVSAAKGLNKVIAERKITKQSPYADQIREVQAMLIDAAKNSPYKIKISDADLAQLVAIVGGHRTYKSVDLLKKFISWGDTERTAEQAAAFHKQIEKALPLIKSDDPYAAEVKQVAKMLSSVKRKSTFHLINTSLSGLAGTLGCLCDSKKGLAGLCDDEPTNRPSSVGKLPPAPYSPLPPISVATPRVASNDPAASADVRKAIFAEPAKPAPAHNVQPTPGVLPVKKRFKDVMSAHEVAAINYPTYEFKNDEATNDWGTLFGRPQKPFAFMISGEPGAGKSTVMMQLAVYLAKNFGPTRYVSSEEYPSLTLADKLERAGGAVKGLSFSKDLSNLSHEIKFLIVDSTNHVKITLPEFLRLRDKYPGMSFGLILQNTKEGQFKGGNEWPHEVDAVFKVVNSPKKGTVITIKNRFVREPGTIRVFKDQDDEPVTNTK